MARHKSKADHRADTRGAALSGFPHAVADSPAYLSLTPFERAVLHEILRRFNGYNNGEIGISYEEIGQRLKGPNTCPPNNGRIARAVARLIEHGLLGEPTPESWLQRKARTYRLTFISSGKAPPYRPATNDYLRWTPTKAKFDGNAASPRKAVSGDAQSPKPSVAGDAQSPDNLKNGSFALADAHSSGDAGSLLILKPYPDAENGRDGALELPGGPNAVEQAIRSTATPIWQALNASGRRSIAERLSLSVDEVGGYIAGTHHLALPKQAALRTALKSVAA